MKNQQELTQEAQEILSQLDLLNLLGKYGETRVVGSVVLELLVKLDLDLHVLLSTYPLMESVNRITTELLDHQHINEVRISDYRPEGVKIGIDECPSVSGNWTIDIWLTNDVSTTAFGHAERILAELTLEKRERILSLKEHYHRQGRLRNGISTLIYQAVLDGITNVRDFERSPAYLKYLEKQGKVGTK
ncbi:MAG: hypothetical protein ACFFDR_12530 [Candidatus Thorarchaeota archaeon]